MSASRNLIDLVGRQAASGVYQETGIQVAGFKSVVKSLGRAKLRPGQAFDSQDVTVEDGDLNLRLGFRNVIPAVTNQTTQKGFKWVRTIVNSVVMESFIAVDTVSGTAKPYEISYDSTNDRWYRTEITLPGGGALSLSDTFWRFASFRSQVFGWNYNSAESASDPGPLVTYTLGDPDTWVAVKRPTKPTATIGVNYARNSSGGAAYAKIAWAGTDLADIAVTGRAAKDAATALSGANLYWEHTAAATLGAASVEVDLSAITAGNQDLTNNDCFDMSLLVGTPANFQFDPESVEMFLRNSSGTETELKVRGVAVRDSSGNLLRYDFRADFNEKTRATWATTQYVRIAYNVTKVDSGSADNNGMMLTPIRKGCIIDWSDDNDYFGQKYKLGYAWYNSTSGYQSDIAGELPLLPFRLFGGESIVGGNLGTIPFLTTTTSAEANVDKVRIFMARRKRGSTRESEQYEKWRLVVEQVDTDTTYTLNTTATDYTGLTEYEPAPFVHDDILCAQQFKGWMVWGYRDGSIRHSRFNAPLLQARDDDAFSTPLDEEDFNRGATFNLVDDVAVGFVEIGDTLVILGEKSCYVQESTNGRPFGMTPPTKLGCPGCIGYEAFAAWKLDNGTPGVVYVSKDGGSVWFIAIYEGAGDVRGPKPLEVTAKIRGYLKSKLYAGSTLTNPERVMVLIDEDTDALVLFYTERALILRRPSLDNNERDWDVCDFETGHHGSTWIKLAYAQGYGLFGVRLNGAVDQFFRANVLDTATNGRTIVDIDTTAYQPTLTDTGTAFTPASTDTAADTVTFAAAKQWVTGLAIVPDATIGGLTNGTTYYLKRVNSTTFQFHTTYEGALLGSAATLVNLTANVTQNLTPRDHVMFGDFDTAGTNPGWSTGMPFTPSVTGGGLTAGVTYYLRRVSKSAYTVHTTLADADANTNAVNLTASITAYFIPAGRDDGTAISGYWESGEWVGVRRRAREARIDRIDLGDQPTVQCIIGTGYVPRSTDTAADTVTFAKAPGWPTGTPVCPSAAGSGLTRVQYFVNKVSDTVYSFHLLESDARTGSNKHNLTGNVTAEIVPGSAPQTVGVGERHVRFGPRCSGQGLRYRIGMTDGMRGIQALETKEPIIGQAEQR